MVRRAAVRRRRTASHPPVAGQTAPASASSVRTPSRSARPGFEVRVMSIGVLPGPSDPTGPVLLPIQTRAGASVLRPKRGRRTGAHAAVPTHRAMLPFLRWLAFVLAGNVVAAAYVLAGGRPLPAPPEYT